MARIFLSHSSKNNEVAVKVRDWLVENGWNDVFLDLDPVGGLAPGERWQEELKRAADRCEAVLFLVTSDWLASKWCLAEFLLAKQLGKRIFPVIVGAVPLDALPVEMTGSHQAVDLLNDPQGYIRLREGLKRAGLDAQSFAFAAGRRPYPGLEPLDENDAAIFFGRESQIVRALDALRGMADAGVERVLVVLGASGSGKSSFMRAGLWPRLKRDDRAFLTLPVVRPERAIITGKFGLAAAVEGYLRENLLASLGVENLPRTRAQLASHLLGSRDALTSMLDLIDKASRGSGEQGPVAIVCIDQGEELLNADGAAEAAHFIELLGNTVSHNRRCLAIVTIRSDVFPRLQVQPQFAEIGHVPFSLPPMPRGSFKQVIEGPATIAGLKLDPHLVDELLADSTGPASAGADTLPLLAFSLARLYQQRGATGRLDATDYMSLGRLSGAIQAAVDESLAEGRAAGRLPTGRRETEALIKQTFVPHLVRVDEAGSFSRRIAEYSSLPAASQPLVDLLVERRLLIRDRRVTADKEVDVLEISHEAILREWPMLRGWLAETREFLDWQRQVERLFLQYEEASERDKEDALLSGLQLSHARRWLAERAETVSEPVRNFIQRSAVKADRRMFRSANLASVFASFAAALAVAVTLICSTVLFRIDAVSMFAGAPVSMPLGLPDRELLWVARYVPAMMAGGLATLLVGLLVLARSIRRIEQALTRLAPATPQTQLFQAHLSASPLARSIAAAPYRSFTTRAAAWTLLGAIILVPILVLLWVQAEFLKYHLESLTWWHRGMLGLALVLAIACLSLLTVRRTDDTALSGLRRSSNGLVVASSAFVAVLIAVTSLFQLNVPNEALEQIITGNRDDTRWVPRLVDSLVQRNFSFRDADLEALLEERKLTAKTDGRDYRFADLTGANIGALPSTIDGAKLSGARIAGGGSSCANQFAEHFDVAFFEVSASEKAADMMCGSARSIDFSGARILAVSFSGMDLEGALFGGAELKQVSFAGANLAGVDFSDASGEMVTFKNAKLYGTRLNGVKMPGAVFTEARLFASTLNNADFDVARFTRALIMSSSVEGSRFTGSDFRRASVFGTDLIGDATLTGADFRGSTIWLSSLPPKDAWSSEKGQQRASVYLLDLEGISFYPPSSQLLSTLSSEIGSIRDTDLRDKLLLAIRKLQEDPAVKKWASSEEQKAWLEASSKRVEQGDGGQLTDLLRDIVCKHGQSGGMRLLSSVITRIYERIAGGVSIRRGKGDAFELVNGPTFRGKIRPLMWFEKEFFEACLMPALRKEEPTASEGDPLDRFAKYIPAEVVGVMVTLAELEERGALPR